MHTLSHFFLHSYRLVTLMFIFCLTYQPIIDARSILGELEIIRALDLAGPHTGHGHRCAGAPFTRHTTMHASGDYQKQFFIGSAFDYKYVHSYGFIEIVTALGYEKIKYNESGKRFERDRFGLDDIGIILDFDVLRYDDNNYVSALGAFALATARANPLGTLVGAGFNEVGAGLIVAFEIPKALSKSWDLRFFGVGLFLQSFEKTVLLNKQMELLSDRSCQKPFFKEKFDIGSGFFNLLGLRSGPDDNGFEIGYHGTIIFNVHNKIKPLCPQELITAAMKSRIDRHKKMEKLTPHKGSSNKATFVHHIYTQYNLVYETDWYPLGLAFGIAYAFGSDSWQEVVLWTSASLHF